MTTRHEFDITFLRKNQKEKRKFLIPEVSDTATISKNDIKMILLKPVNYGHTRDKILINPLK